MSLLLVTIVYGFCLVYINSRVDELTVRLRKSEKERDDRQSS